MYSGHLVGGLATPIFSYQFYFGIIDIVASPDPSSYFVHRDMDGWILLIALGMSISGVLSQSEVFSGNVKVRPRHT